MDEITLRLPAATTATLQSEAEERGVTVDEHIRDIIDAYQAGDEEGRPDVAVEYAHAVGSESTPVSDTQATDEPEEIGSFSYGSRSIISK